MRFFVVHVIQKLILSENSTAAEWWENPPVYPLLKVHVFNYTNTEDFFAGKATKLQVEDLGPYVYKETANKVDITHNGDGTISYRVSGVITITQTKRMQNVSLYFN